QNSLSVAQYIKEFERLSIACDCKDEEEKRMPRFVMGLNIPIRNLVELQQYNSLDEVTNLACKVERQQIEAKARGFRGFNTQKGDSSSSNDTPSPIKNETIEPSTPKAPLFPNKSKEKVCFKCWGQGHVKAQCPNKTMVNRRAHLALLSDYIELLEEEERSIAIGHKDDKDDEGGDAHGTICPPDDSYVAMYETKPMNKKTHKAMAQQRVLQITQKPPFDIGDYVWLTLDKKKLHEKLHGKEENMDEGPFKVVHRVDYDTFQVLLGRGVCASFKQCDLIPCFNNT
ncbi:Maintenance of telomere capping protein 6, partial [Bienertia sinuspersici]